MSSLPGSIVFSEERVVAAMRYWERKHIEENGPLDRITLPPDVSRLATLLGVMWFEREREALVSCISPIAQLILKAETA